MANLTQVKAQIRQIDRSIDGVRRELFSRAGAFNTMSANAWQLAWDRFPDLHALEQALFLQRGQLQAERDKLQDEAYRAQLRMERRAAKKAAKGHCAACGQLIAA